MKAKLLNFIGFSMAIVFFGVLLWSVFGVVLHEQFRWLTEIVGVILITVGWVFGAFYLIGCGEEKGASDGDA